MEARVGRAEPVARPTEVLHVLRRHGVCQICVYCAWVQAEGLHAPGAELLRERDGEEHVGGFGLPVRQPFVVGGAVLWYCQCS